MEYDEATGTIRVTGDHSRFDLEQGILSCWSITDDIENLRKMMLDRKEKMTEDEIDNYLLGLKSVYGVRFQLVFDLFEKMIAERRIK